MKLNSIPTGFLTAALFLACITPNSVRADADSGVEHIKLATGQILYEFVGAGFNLTPPASAQVGYFSYIKGLDTLFTGLPENETNALFTFYRDTTTLRVRANGPMLIVIAS